MDLTALSDDDLRALEARAMADPSILGDVMTQAPIGLARGAAYVAGMPGDMIKAARAGASWMGLPTVGDKNHPETPMNKVVGSEDLIRGMETVTGKFPEPQTGWGEAMRTGMEFVPSALLGPGSAMRKAVGYVALPTATTEAGGAAGEVAGGLLGNPERGKQIGRTVGGLTGLGVGAVARNPLRSGKTMLADNLDADAAKQFDWLGDEAMLGEGTPASFGLMQGVGSRPDSKGMNTLVDAVTKRDQGKNLRINSEVNQQLGTAPLPSNLELGLAKSRSDLSPDYERILNEPNIAPPREAVGRLDYLMDPSRGAVTGSSLNALKRVREMLQPGNTQTKISLRGLHETRKELDAMIETAKTQGNKGLLSHLGGLRKDVDGAMKAASKDLGDVDAAFQHLTKQSDALEKGSMVLADGKTTIRPRELDDMLAAMSPEEKGYLIHGVRAEIDRIVGTKANDVNALNSLVKGEGDWNRAKLTSLFGAEKTDKIFSAIARERRFQDNYNKITQGSQTAQRRAGQEAVARGTVNPPPITMMQFAGSAARKGVDSVTGGFYANRDKKLAELMTLQGAERDRALAELLKIGEGRKRGVPWAPGVSTLLSPFRTELDQ
jgi:hypothetical protein